MGVYRVSSEAMRVRIQHRGLPPLPPGGALTFLILLAFAGTFLVVVLQGLGTRLPGDPLPTGELLWESIAYVLLFCVPAFGLIFLALRRLLAGSDHWRNIEWDRSTGFVRAKRARPLRRDRAFELPLEQIDTLDTWLGPQGEGPIALRMLHTTRAGKELPLQFAIDTVERREEALDLLYTIAHVSGLLHCRLEEEGDALLVTLERDPSAASQPTPQADPVWSYGLDHGGVGPSGDAPLEGAIGPRAWSEIWQTIRRTIHEYVGIGILLGVLGLLVSFGYGVWMQGRLAGDRERAARRVEAAGAAVQRVRVTVGETPILSDGYLVTPQDPGFGDEELEALLPLIDQLPIYGLDLSHTSITDAAIDRFADTPSLFLLSARGTALSPAATAALARSNIQALDLRATGIRLEHIGAWSDYHALAALYVTDPEVSADDLAQLARIPRLRYLLVNDEATTRPLIDSLSRELESGGATEFDRLRFSDLFSVKLAPPLQVAPLRR